MDLSTELVLFAALADVVMLLVIAILVLVVGLSGLIMYTSRR